MLSRKSDSLRRSTPRVTGKANFYVLTPLNRGFGFVEFVSSEEAKGAFSQLQHTHLYGRKLIIEWAKPEQEDFQTATTVHTENNKRQKTQ